MIPNVPNPVQSKPNFERRRSFAIGAQKEGFRSGTKESYFNQNIISLAPGADIQQAIDTVAASGGGTVVLLNGTHEWADNLYLLSGVSLEGETLDTTLDFMFSEGGIIIAGDGQTVTGTVAVTNSSPIVVGTGTDFDGSYVGQSLFLDGDWIEVISVESTTSLTLASDYSGSSQSGLAAVLAIPIASPEISRLIVQNSSLNAIDIQYADFPIFRDFSIYSSGVGIYCNYSTFNYFVNFSIEDCGIGMDLNNTFVSSILSWVILNSATYGVKMTNSGDSTLFDISIVNSGSVGLYMDNCDGVTVASFSIDDNTSHGIEMVANSNDNQLTQGTSNRNGGDGIKLTATSDQNAIFGCTLSNNTGYGINVAAASCDNNVIGTAILVSNTAGQLNNAGTGGKGRGIIGAADFG